MDIRQLRYLVAVADELSFTRAAERCHVSQPPLSRAIALLEQEVGARLVERDRHRVALTPAGTSLVADARRALESLGEAGEKARRIADGLVGTLAIGFGGTTLYHLLPMLIRRFRAVLPEVEIRFQAMPVLEQIDALRRGEIDIGILRLPVHDELIETRRVRREPLIMALPDGHPLVRQGEPIAIAQLAGQPLVAYQPRRGFSYHVDLLALCRLAGFDPRIVHEAGTTEAVIGIVACGEGMSLVPAAARHLQMRGVAYRRLARDGVPQHLIQVEFALAWRRDNPSPITLEFVRHATRRSAPR